MTKKEAETILKNMPMQGNVDLATSRQDLYRRGHAKGFFEGYIEACEKFKPLVEAVERIRLPYCYYDCWSYENPGGECTCGLVRDKQIIKEALAKFKEE